MTEASIPSEMKFKRGHKDASKTFDYVTIADRRRAKLKTLKAAF